MRAEKIIAGMICVFAMNFSLFGKGEYEPPQLPLNGLVFTKKFDDGRVIQVIEQTPIDWNKNNAGKADNPNNVHRHEYVFKLTSADGKQFTDISTKIGLDSDISEPKKGFVVFDVALDGPWAVIIFRKGVRAGADIVPIGTLEKGQEKIALAEADQLVITDTYGFGHVSVAGKIAGTIAREDLTIEIDQMTPERKIPHFCRLTKKDGQWKWIASGNPASTQPANAPQNK